MKKIDKIYFQLQNTFSAKLDAAALEVLGTEFETAFDILILRLVTKRVDGKRISKKDWAFIEAYSRGYQEAMNQVGAHR